MFGGLSPPLRVGGNLLAKPARSKWLRSFIALLFLSVFLTPAKARGSSMLSSTFNEGIRLKS